MANTNKLSGKSRVLRILASKKWKKKIGIEIIEIKTQLIRRLYNIKLNYNCNAQAGLGMDILCSMACINSFLCVSRSTLHDIIFAIRLDDELGHRGSEFYAAHHFNCWMGFLSPVNLPTGFEPHFQVYLLLWVRIFSRMF
jgi:hypothetical protein